MLFPIMSFSVAINQPNVIQKALCLRVTQKYPNAQSDDAIFIGVRACFNISLGDP